MKSPHSSAEEKESSLYPVEDSWITQWDHSPAFCQISFASAAPYTAVVPQQRPSSAAAAAATSFEEEGLIY